MGSYSVVQCIRCLMGQTLFSAVNAGMWGESMTQQFHLASMAAWLSSTGISHHNLLPHIPSIPSLRSQQQPSPWDCSTVAKLQLPAAALSRGLASLSGVCVAAARTV